MKPINILLNIDESYISKAKYVFRTFFSVIGMQPIFYNTFGPANVDIYYGEPTIHEYPIKIYYNDSTAEFFRQKQLVDKNSVNFVRYKEKSIPFLFSDQGEIFAYHKKHCIIRKDIIASAFYFLSCWQEWVYNKEYPHDYHSYNFLQIEHNFNNTPVVDWYINILKSALKNTMLQLVSKSVWGKYDYAVSVSHNLTYWNFWTDALYQKYKKNFFTHFKKSPIKSIKNIWIHRNENSADFYTERKLTKLISKSAKFGIQPSIFVLAGSNYSDQRMNYLRDSKVRKKLRKVSIESNLNFYGSPESSSHLPIAKNEYNDLASTVSILNGYRSFRLTSNYQQTFSLLDKLGINYSSLLGFRETTGFRAGVSFPFYPYNHEEDTNFDFLEIPVSIMDLSLFSASYLNLKPNQAIGMLKEINEEIKMLNGHISIAWNMRMFDPIDFEQWQKLYWKFLNIIQKDNGWIQSTDQIYQFWVHRIWDRKIFKQMEDNSLVE
jgi:hypothetical protein